MVRSSSGLIEVRDHPGLLDWWLANYPGPGGLASYWYSLDAPVVQARAALGCMDAAHADPVLSGEVAADALAPWQRPRRVQIYARAGTSLADAGFVPVPDEASATLCVTVPEDPGLWLPEQWLVGVGGRRAQIADPLQVLWDVAAAAGPAATEAVTHLRQALATTLADRWCGAGAIGRRHRGPTDVRPPVAAAARRGNRS
jgi:hypothetical protein